jgi:hypothetical protein
VDKTNAGELPGPGRAIGPRGRLAAGLLLALAGLVVLFTHDPATSGVFPPCPLHAVTGLYCPGCGSLRALHQMLHGNLYAAFRLNPLMVVSIPFLAYPLASAIIYLIRGRPLPRVLVSATWVWIVLTVVVLYAILRNIPQYPLDLLAPS